jgi:hypothetical protein
MARTAPAARMVRKARTFARRAAPDFGKTSST